MRIHQFPLVDGGCLHSLFSCCVSYCVVVESHLSNGDCRIMEPLLMLGIHFIGTLTGYISTRFSVIRSS